MIRHRLLTEEPRDDAMFRDHHDSDHPKGNRRGSWTESQESKAAYHILHSPRGDKEKESSNREEVNGQALSQETTPRFQQHARYSVLLPLAECLVFYTDASA